jgi:hypothetical protein
MEKDPAFVRRQAQWDLFHSWEDLQSALPISIDERVAWYVAADRFSRAHSPQEFNVHARVEEIRQVRESLARLKHVSDDGRTG